MKNVRKMSLALIAVSAITALAGCTPGGDDDTIWVEEGATKVTVYAREFEAWSKDHLKKLVNDFNSNLTDGIQVSVNFFSANNYSTALTVARENNRAPDLYMTTYSELYNSNIKGGHAAKLEDYLTAAQLNDIIPTYKEMCTYDGHLYAAPWNIEPGSLFFYRKDMLQRAGINEAPKTWEELQNTCAALVREGVVGRGQYACGMPLGSTECTWVTYGMQMDTTGGLMLEDDWRTLRITQNENKQGFRDLAKLFYDMYSNNYCQTGTITNEGYTYIVDALCDGNMAMTFSGSWGLAEVFQYTEGDMSIVNNIGVAPIPTQDGIQTGPTSANGGWCYAMSEESRNKDKAAAFLKWMLFEDAERTGEYFIKAYQSKTAPLSSVQNYLNTIELNVPQQWFDVCNAVGNVGFPEATFPWDIGLEYGKLLETMELNCKKGEFETLYAAALSSLVGNCRSIMSRDSYPENPKYDYGE